MKKEIKYLSKILLILFTIIIGSILLGFLVLPIISCGNFTHTMQGSAELKHTANIMDHCNIYKNQRKKEICVDRTLTLLESKCFENTNKLKLTSDEKEVITNEIEELDYYDENIIKEDY